METQMKWRELRDEAILRVLEGGEDVVLTHDGTPIAKVIPIRHPRQFVPTEEVVQAFKDLPPIDYERFRADLDAVADPYVDLGRPGNPKGDDGAEQ